MLLPPPGPDVELVVVLGNPPGPMFFDVEDVLPVEVLPVLCFTDMIQ